MQCRLHDQVAPIDGAVLKAHARATDIQRGASGFIASQPL
jgi:hypothetical protein